MPQTGICWFSDRKYKGDALVLADLLVELQLRLDVLGGVGDADLDAAGDPSGDDSCKLIGMFYF